MLYLVFNLLVFTILGQDPVPEVRSIPDYYKKVTTLRGQADFSGRSELDYTQTDDGLFFVDSSELDADIKDTQDTIASLKTDNILEDVYPDGRQTRTYITDSYWAQNLYQELIDKEKFVVTADCDPTNQNCDQDEDEADECDPDEPPPNDSFAIAVRRLWILGSDTREERFGNPITTLPSRQAGRLTFNTGSGSGWCSAVIVGPRHIITAGHCVHGGRGGSWFSGFRFWPRQNRLDVSSSIGWRRIRTFTGWTRRSSRNWDIAIMELSSNIPSGIGWMSFGWTTTSTLRPGRWIYHRGYPSDKSFRSMWTSWGRIWRRWTHQLHTDTTDLTRGTSGGGWWAYPNGKRINYAVTSYQSRTWWGKRFNGHTRITRSKFNSFCDFICLPNVCC